MDVKKSFGWSKAWPAVAKVDGLPGGGFTTGLLDRAARSR